MSADSEAPAPTTRGVANTILSLLIVLGCVLAAWLVFRQDSDPSGEEGESSPEEPISGYATPPQVRAWQEVEDFDQPLAQFETVFWEPEDTRSLRSLIRKTDLVQDRTVMEIGTGTGLIALCCVQGGADAVLATDINPSAVACARYNARRLGIETHLEVRQVSLDAPGAFEVLDRDERFDLIISNPPWEDATPQTVGEFALYDPSFALLESLITGCRNHLRPGGRVLLAYGCVSAIREIHRLAELEGFEVDRP